MRASVTCPSSKNNVTEKTCNKLLLNKNLIKLSHSEITSAGIQSIIGKATVYQSIRALMKAE